MGLCACVCVSVCVCVCGRVSVCQVKGTSVDELFKFFEKKVGNTVFDTPPLPPTSGFVSVCYCVCEFGFMRLWVCGVVSLWMCGLVFCGFVRVCVCVCVCVCVFTCLCLFGCCVFLCDHV